MTRLGKTLSHPAIVDSLESRVLFSVALSGTTLIITGTASSDTLILRPSPADPRRLEINLNGSVGGVRFDRFDTVQLTMLKGDDMVSVEAPTDSTLVSKKVIAYLGGNNDRFYGATQDPEIHAGNGDDVVDLSASGAGSYVLLGAGNDFFVGSAGNDTVQGEEGNDTLGGSWGYDELHGDEGDDSIGGGPGFDALYGEDGNDTLVGGKGDDDLYGNSGDDVIYGGLGNDYMEGGAGRNLMYGKEGIDHIVTSPDAGPDTVSGGGQEDILDTQANTEIIDR